MTIDWRTPENRREGFQRFYTFQLQYRNFPGMVYSMLPAVADALELDDDQRAWLAWLNGNTQNVVTSLVLLREAPIPSLWGRAVQFWNDNFTALEWDADRRHQKGAFGDATEKWFRRYGTRPAEGWEGLDWEAAWKHAIEQPFMGRISAWSMIEFARILLPDVPDAEAWYLEEPSSRSHRNSLCVLAGYDSAWSWDKEDADLPLVLDLLPGLHDLAEDLFTEARYRNFPDFDVSRLTMESALCTWKSMHKSRRRYPNVYADMMYERIRKSEARLGSPLDLLWRIREQTLPAALRLEANAYDPGLSEVKQDWFRTQGELLYLHLSFCDMEPSGFEEAVASRAFGLRKEKVWK